MSKQFAFMPIHWLFKQLPLAIRDVGRPGEEFSDYPSAIDNLLRQGRQNEELIKELFIRLERIEGNAQSSLGTINYISRILNKDSEDSEKIRVGFLVHNFEAWGSISSVVRAMSDDIRFDVSVFSINRKFPGSPDYRDEEVTSRRLFEAGIPHIRLNDKDSFKDLDRLKSLGIKIIFRQSQWENDVPPAFGSRHLSFAKQYYIPYEITTIAKHGLNFISSHHHHMCERYFVASELAKEMASDYDAFRGARMTVTGHPKVNEVLNAEASWPISSGNSYRIIWSAHHTIHKNWNNFGVFFDVYQEILDFAKSRPDIDVLFSPHPALLTIVQSSEAIRSAFQEFLVEWGDLPNTGVLDSGRYFGPFKAADLLIVDGLSFLIEFQLNLKPIIWLSRPDHSEFNEFGELVVAGTHELPISDISALEETIEGFISGTTKPRMEEQRKVKELLTKKADPAQEILDYVYQDACGGSLYK